MYQSTSAREESQPGVTSVLDRVQLTPLCRWIRNRGGRHMGRRDRGGFDEPGGGRRGGGGRREEGPGRGRDRFEDRGGQPEVRDARLAEFRERVNERLDRFDERLQRLEERLERLSQGG
jgi:hypothetical protein